MQEHALFWCSSVADPAQAVFLNEGWPNPSGAGNSLGSVANRHEIVLFGEGLPGCVVELTKKQDGGRAALPDVAGECRFSAGWNNCGQSSRLRLGAPSVASLGVPSPKVVPRGMWRKAGGQGMLADLG